jgi:hypothetical protein
VSDDLTAWLRASAHHLAAMADGAAAAAPDATLGTQNGTELQLVDARRAFDAVVHIDRVTPWHTWIPTLDQPERR